MNTHEHILDLVMRVSTILNLGDTWIPETLGAVRKVSVLSSHCKCMVSGSPHMGLCPGDTLPKPVLPRLNEK